VQLAQQGIRVAGLHVGPMDTDMIRDVTDPEADPAHVARIAVDGIAPASTRSSQTTSAARSSPGCTEALRRSTRSWSEREWWRTQRDDGVSRVVAGLDR
jgi:hypothetical protein